MALLAMMIARFMVTVAVIGSVTIYFYFYILKDKSPWQPGKQPYLAWDYANRRKVLILKEPGARVSIIGQIFNQHPGVFYMNEPLYPFEMFRTLNYTKRGEYNGQVRAFLDNVFHCRFYGYDDYLTFFSHPGLTDPRYRLSSRSLSSPPLCYSHMENFTSLAAYSANCPILVPRWISRVCAREPHAVVSIASKRAPGGGLTGLIPLITSEALSVIHVVTDPRMRVWEGSLDKDTSVSFHDYAQKECAEVERELNASLSLRARDNTHYHVLKYEDFIHNVSSAAPEVIRVVDLHYLPEVRDWVQVKSGDWVEAESKRHGVPVDEWRVKMSDDQLAATERFCAFSLRKLGYKFGRS
ncbi:predicted protein [Nematostella vectensis]|uniref:Sulfotransferase n=1 Tax=Nematostella vectensis TaxID=45351 RepID=A7S4Z0_NEMVE|nr:carbohydrate sulfotransferase 3 [Nematostella vectensis]EDO41237.1 predicted protein [Nematostella vectensis]|eukprot:XP_001633300.1 predicted protein [Nematostella vectensis]